MKTLVVVFDDDDYKRLVDKKGSMIWRDFILTLAGDII